MGQMLLTGAGGGASTLGLKTNLVAWWELDEASGSRADSHTNGYTLTDNNTVTSAAGVGGVGTAASFEVSNLEYLSRASAANLLLTGDFTIIAFIYPDSLVGGDVSYGRGFARYSTGTVIGNWSMIAFPNGKFACMHWENNGNDVDGFHTTDNAVVSDGVWAFVAFRRASGAYTLRVGTTNQAVTRGGTGSGWGNVGIELGRHYTDAGYTWDGRIAKFGVFSAALTDDNLTTLYNNGAGRTYAEL